MQHPIIFVPKLYIPSGFTQCQVQVAYVIPALHTLMLSLRVPRGAWPVVELSLLLGVSWHSWLAYTLSGYSRTDIPR